MICNIFAMDRMGGIGLNRDFHWAVDDAYKSWFAKQVQDQILVVGSRTWSVLVKHGLTPWARKIYVVTKSCSNNNVTCVQGNLVEVVKDIQQLHPDRDVYVVGGKQLFEATRHIVERMNIAHINGHWHADARIYSGYFLSGFQVTRVEPTTDKKYTYMTYRNLLPL